MAAMCSLDKKTNIEIADKMIHSLAPPSLTSIDERIAIFTNTLARIPSIRTKSLGRANFLATSLRRKLSWVKWEKADELAKAHPATKAPIRLNRVQYSKMITAFFQSIFFKNAPAVRYIMLDVTNSAFRKTI